MGMAGTPWGQWGWGQGAPPRPKKKCVNGFIMFCRLNRKAYIRWGHGDSGGGGHGDPREDGDTGTLRGTWGHGLSPERMGTWGQ